MASPFQRNFFTRIATKAAATATRDDAAIRAPFAGNVTEVTVMPDVTLTGADTNSATLSLINKGLTGGDTRVAATRAFTNGQTATAFDETSLTVSGTAANTAVVAGDVLAVSVIKVGSGLTTPDMLVKIGITATD